MTKFEHPKMEFGIGAQRGFALSASREKARSVYGADEMATALTDCPKVEFLLRTGNPTDELFAVIDRLFVLSTGGLPSS